MEVFQLLQGLQFHDANPSAEPLLVNRTGRILRFTLHPGQEVREHAAPTSPVYIIVLKGHGLFSGAEGREEMFGPDTLLTFTPGETHAIRAVDEELVFVAFLHEAPRGRPQ